MHEIKYTSSESIRRFIIYSIGYEACSAGHNSGTAMTDRYLIHYILSGKGIYRTPDKTYELSAGNAFLIGKNFGYYEADKDEPWEYAWITVSGSPVNDFLEKAGLSEDNPIYTAKFPDKAETLFRNLIDTEGKDDYKIYSDVFGLFSELLEIGTYRAPNTKNTGARYVDSVCDFIAANYHRKISAEDISEYVGLEYSYLYRLFKKTCGISPAAYLNDYRLNKAAELCKRGMSVKEIAPSVGYNDRSTFSRAFSRHFGMSVSEYKSSINN